MEQGIDRAAGLLEQLARQLGIAAEYAWPRLVQLHFAYGLGQLGVLILLWTILAVVEFHIWRAANFYWARCQVELKELEDAGSPDYRRLATLRDAEAESCLCRWITLGVAVVLFALSSLFLPDALAKVLSPEGYAIADLIRQAGAKK